MKRGKHCKPGLKFNQVLCVEVATLSENVAHESLSAVAQHSTAQSTVAVTAFISKL